MDLLRIKCVRLLKDKSEKNIYTQIFYNRDPKKRNRINGIAKVNMGTSSIKRDIITFINIYSYYLNTASENYLNALSQSIRVVYNFEIIFTRACFQTNNL